MFTRDLQGYLVHKKPPPPPRTTIPIVGVAVSYQQGTLVAWQVDKKGILWDYKAVKSLPLIGIDGVPSVDDSRMV